MLKNNPTTFEYNNIVFDKEDLLMLDSPMVVILPNNKAIHCWYYIVNAEGSFLVNCGGDLEVLNVIAIDSSDDDLIAYCESLIF